MELRTIAFISLLLTCAAPPGSLTAQSGARDVTTEASEPMAADSIKPRTAGDQIPADAATRQGYDLAVTRARLVLLGWLILVLVYLGWAIHRYVYNYGLSNREWKVLYPAVYVTWFDRLLIAAFKLQSYEQRRDELDDYRRRQRELAADERVALPATAITRLLDEPDKNPYQGDSFGLPPGTIRGIIALTALVIFGLIEYVNLYSGVLEFYFPGVVLAVQMILAFYFGSRAVEVFKAAEAKQKPQPGRPVPATAAATSAVTTWRRALTRPAEEPEPEPEPFPIRTALPETKTGARFASIVAAARSNGPGAFKKAAAGPLTAASPLTPATPLERRVLALTAAFETGSRGSDGFGALAGDFDGQGLSFGALQWNIGQHSLQPLWQRMLATHPDKAHAILGDQFDTVERMLKDRHAEQMAWARSIQRIAAGRAGAWTIIEPWKSRLQALGRCDEMVEIQVAAANTLYLSALAFCEDYGLGTERGAALMFDIAVQNGSVDRGGAGARIREDFEFINPTLSMEEQEVERMRIIARDRAAVARPTFRGDVLARKMTIAEGFGLVHGRRYQLEDDFAISLTPLPALV
jgi:hypothetical protein